MLSQARASPSTLRNAPHISSLVRTHLRVRCGGFSCEPRSCAFENPACVTSGACSRSCASSGPSMLNPFLGFHFGAAQQSPVGSVVGCSLASTTKVSQSSWDVGILLATRFFEHGKRHGRSRFIVIRGHFRILSCLLLWPENGGELS